MSTGITIHIVLILIVPVSHSPCFSEESGIIYSNPRVYNVEYAFEMSPDPNKINRGKDLKLWLFMPREWESQKAVKIISVEPTPHAEYTDPEYGNPMLFWDFGKEAEQPTYRVDIKFRLESYDIRVKVDPNRVGSYDKSSKEYTLYTRSTHTINITPKIREMAREAIGDEKNPYLQAKRILLFVNKKMRYKRWAFERGRGIKCLLDYPVVDEKTGEEYYEGSCVQDTALFVALCRAVGIPARCVGGYIGWSPGGKTDGLKAKYPFETKISPEGLAATQFYMELDAHMWGECFVPNYGWIPTGGKLEHQNNKRWIMYKGPDIQIGPFAPQKDNEGYGAWWVELNNGRVDMGMAVMNIRKIHDSKIKVLHHSNPFPTDGLCVYGQHPFNFILNGSLGIKRGWRQEVLNLPSCVVGSPISENINLAQIYSYRGVRDFIDAFICDMLRQEIGDEPYSKLIDEYTELRQTSEESIPTSRFQELAEEIHDKPLGWFFDQWLRSDELPRLSLEKVAATRDGEGWRLKGQIRQSTETVFRLPVEIAIDTSEGRELRTLGLQTKATEFDFLVQDQPQKLTVDPDYKLLKIQRMAPRSVWFWYVYPNCLVVYGTQAGTTMNKIAAEQFITNLGLDQDKVKADNDVTDADLKNKWIFLIGTPQTNKIAQRFQGSFPIQFEGAQFTWQNILYDKPTQGVTQVIENPVTHKGYVVMYAGLSSEAMRILSNLQLYGSDNSYVIFDGYQEIVKGDWEDVDSNIFCEFESDSANKTKSK
jgi:hypothetical protein